MGNGFALPIAYEIKSFRLIIAYTDKPAVLFSANGSQLTRRMLQKIEGLKKGDRILIEAIKAQEKTMGFNANLSPIIITVIGQKKHISQVYGKFEYVKVFDSDKADSNQYHLPIYGVNNIPDEFKNGVLSKFYNGHKGFHRIDETFKDGVVKKEVFIDDMGIKVYERTIKDSILSELKTFYETGELKTLGPVKMGIKYMGNDHFVYCFHPNKEPANSDVQIRRMEDYDTCLFLTEESIEKDLHQIYLRYGFVPHESFTSYYKSGSLKTGGNLMILMGRDEPTPDTYTYLERKEYYPYHDKSAMKGEWFFYNEDGSLIEKRIYQAGKRVF
jgi:antitoxin component YwqK of YwqJK toxin-antitoxin module